MKSRWNDKFYPIRFNSRTIRFPQICPICGDPASEQGIIFSTVRKPKWDYGEGHKRIVRMNIPVCKVHYSPAISKRIISVLTLIGGISLMALLLLSTIIAFYIYDKLAIGSVLSMSWLASCISLMLSWHILGANELNDVVSISSSSVANLYWYMRVRHKWYRDELLRLNAKNAQVPRYKE